MRKSVFGVSDQVRHKPGCTASEGGLRFEIAMWEVEELYYVAKTKTLISCEVNALLICAFVFAY